jgi:hypothetical protein
VTRGRGSSNRGRTQTPKSEGESSSSQSLQRGDFRGRRFGSRGRGIRREVRCYTCGEIGHMSWDSPRNKTVN